MAFAPNDVENAEAEVDGCGEKVESDPDVEKGEAELGAETVVGCWVNKLWPRVAPLAAGAGAENRAAPVV